MERVSKGMKKKLMLASLLATASLGSMFVFNHAANAQETAESKLNLRANSLLRMPVNIPQEHVYDSGITIPYPKDGVKGVYLQAFRAKGQDLENMIQFIKSTPINSVVIDVRDGYGKITMPLDTDNEEVKEHTFKEVPDTTALLKRLEKEQIYPIARIVCFGDRYIPKVEPERSFRNALGQLWYTDDGETFLNPFLKENWEYIAEIAIGAAKAGFKDIQLDYVRFPLGFETVSDDLVFDKGDYAHIKNDDEARIAAITDFVAFIREKLLPYGVHLSADILAHAITESKIGGIGQKFVNIAEKVDVISPMIFPSHWVKYALGVKNPDKDPYEIVKRYMLIEKDYVKTINPSPISRPWIQAFTADFLGEGNYQLYTADVISEEIQALKEAGVTEYLLWNAASQYSTKIKF